MMTSRLKILLGSFLLLVVGCFCVRAEDADAMDGKPAPPLNVPTAAGGSVNLSDYKGKVVLVDFWATWCPPCLASLPHLQKLSEDKTRANKGLVVLVVNSAEDLPTIKAFLAANPYTFTIPIAAPSDIDHWDAAAIPRTMVVGRDGVIKKAFVGADETVTKDIVTAVDVALASK